MPARTCDQGTDGPRSGGAASGGRGAVYGKAFHVGCTSSGRFGEWRFSGCRCGSGGGSPSPPENFSGRCTWADGTCLAGALEGSVLTGDGVVQAVGVAAGGTVGTGGWGDGDGDGHGGRAGGGCAAGGGVAGMAG